MGKLNHCAIYNGDVKITTSDVPVDSNYNSVPDTYITPIKSIGYDDMDHLREFFHSENDDDLLDVELQMLQAWLVVAPPSKFYTVSTMLFHKYRGANFSVKKFMSHFSMFVPNKDTVKLANGNTGNYQWIGIILCRFPNCSIIYTVMKAT